MILRTISANAFHQLKINGMQVEQPKVPLCVKKKYRPLKRHFVRQWTKKTTARLCDRRLRLIEETLTLCRIVWKRFRIAIRINRSIDPIIIRLALGRAAVVTAVVSRDSSTTRQASLNVPASTG